VARARRPVRRVGAPALLLVLSLAGSLRAESLAPPEGEAWRQVEVERLVVCGNESEATLREVAASLGRLRAVLGSLTRGGRLRSPLPTEVVVFRSCEQLQRFGLWKDGTPIPVEGFFKSAPDASRIGLCLDRKKDSQAIVYHELLHEYLAWNLPPLPVWFEEGLAEYYSTFTTSGDRATVGGIHVEHLRLLRQGVPMKLEELFAVGKESPWYTERSRRGPFYAEAWAFTHFLLHSDPGLSARLFRFLGRMSEGAAQAEAFREAFGRSEAEVFADFVVYLRGPRFVSYTIPLPPGTAEPSRAVALPRADVLVRLAGLLLPDAARDAETEGLLSEALALYPGHPGALAGRARLAARAGRPEDELALYRRAAEAPDAAAGVHYGLGVALLGRVRVSAATGLHHEMVDEARRALGSALRKDPAFTPARVALGRSFLLEVGEAAAPGVAHLEAALAEGAPEPGLRADLAALRRRADGRPSARSPDGGETREPGLARVRAESDSAVRLLAEGKADEAIARMEALRTSVEKEELRAAVDDEAGRLRALAAHQDLARKYSDGVRLLREGRTDEALAVLRMVAAAKSEPALATSAGEMVAEIEKALAAAARKRKR